MQAYLDGQHPARRVDDSPDWTSPLRTTTTRAEGDGERVTSPGTEFEWVH